MQRLWLVFAQTVTVCVAVLFVLTTLKPGWFTPPAGRAVRIQQVAESNTPHAPTVDSYAAAAARATPAVVHIYTRQQINPHGRLFHDDPLFRRFFGLPDRGRPPGERSSGLGSGVIVSTDGYILTNNHVIENASSIEVALNDGRKFAARLVGRDPESDLAVLRAEHGNETLPLITFADDRRLHVGDVVLAIGNPFGVGQTVTMGIVSALDRRQLGLSTFERFIQTDAAINPGNSGGALVDRNGHLIGINTAIYSRTGGSLGIGFAIPASAAQSVLSQIVAHGEVTRGWLGVEIQALTPELALSFGHDEEHGALIAGVLRGSPAAESGLRLGDIVTAIDGTVVTTSNEFLERIAALAPGQRARLTLFRAGREMDVEITAGRRPAVQEALRR